MRDFPPPWELLPFYQAIIRNDMETVKVYLKKYKRIANFELTDILRNLKVNAVAAAIYSGNIEMLKLMREEWVDTNLPVYYGRYGGYTSLHIAIQQQRIDMIEYLLNHGADPRITDDNGNNVFHYIANVRNSDIARILIKHAPDLLNRERHDEPRYPLTTLILGQFNDGECDTPEALELLELFLSGGADVSLLFEERDYFDPFTYCIEARNNDYLTLLLSYLKKRLPDLTEGLGRSYNYSINYLNVAIGCGNFDIVPELIPYIRDINSTNPTGQTALHYAAAYSAYADFNLIKTLIENGADKTIRGNDGLTAYDMYMVNNTSINEEIINILKVD